MGRASALPTILLMEVYELMAIDLLTNTQKFISAVTDYKDLNMSFTTNWDTQTGRVTVTASYRKNVLSFTNPSDTETTIFRSDTPNIYTHTYTVYATALQNVEYNFVFEALLSSFTRLVQNWLTE